MSLRFISQLQIDNLPDEQINDQFEVIMPKLNLSDVHKKSEAEKQGFLSKLSSIGSDILYNYQPIVEQITFGTMNFKPATRRVRTGWINVPEDIENWHKASITMFCSAGMLTQQYLDAWRRLIFEPSGEYYNPNWYYKRNIIVNVFGPTLSKVAPPIYTFTLKGCFPLTQEDFRFEYSNDPKRVTILATFSVDKVVYDPDKAKYAAISELVTSPSSILDKAISTFSTDNSAYSTGNTYGKKSVDNPGLSYSTKNGGLTNNIF